MELDIENIDALIKHWRKVRDQSEDHEGILMAKCYVDAFQTVRVNHGLELLPQEEES